jgi:DNA-binding NarL/FixJ family response regulator
VEKRIEDRTRILSADTSILVVDDHPLYREALVSAVRSLGEGIKISVSGTFDDAITVLSEDLEKDLVLLDLHMPDSKGLSGLSQMRARFPSIPVIIVSATEDPAIIRKSIAMGASGYVRKSSDIEQMRAAIQQVLSGEIYTPSDIDLNVDADSEEAELIERLNSLTPQQTRVLGMLGKGLLNKQIAYELSVSEATVKAHVSAILLKLRVDSRTQAVIMVNALTSIDSASEDVS